MYIYMYISMSNSSVSDPHFLPGAAEPNRELNPPLLSLPAVCSDLTQLDFLQHATCFMEPPLGSYMDGGRGAAVHAGRSIWITSQSL